MPNGETTNHRQKAWLRRCQSFIGNGALLLLGTLNSETRKHINSWDIAWTKMQTGGDCDSSTITVDGGLCPILGKEFIYSKLTLSHIWETFGSLLQFLNQGFWGGYEIFAHPHPDSPLIPSVSFTPSSLLWNVKQISPIPLTGCATWHVSNCAQNVNAYLPHQLEHRAVCYSRRRVLGQK